MSLVSHVSCHIASDPFQHSHLSQIASWPVLKPLALPSPPTSPFHHHRLKSNFFLWQMLPDTPTPRALFCLGINHNSAQRIKSFSITASGSKGTKEGYSFIQQIFVVKHLSLFMFPSNFTNLGDTIMSKHS